MDLMGDKALAWLARYLGAPLATLYVTGRRRGSAAGRDLCGRGDAASSPAVVAAGEGMIGQVAKDDSILHVRAFPTTTSASNPRSAAVGRAS